MKRRQFSISAVLVTLSSVLEKKVGPIGIVSVDSALAKEAFEVTKTDAEWKATLTSEQYNVLRHHGTEPAGSSPLDKNYSEGVYLCAGCDLPLFSSETKFNSGTGWPSFFETLENAVGSSTDFKLIYPRTEIHCRRCGGHLGHVFNDGPPPTGKRYCMNGVALKFVANQKK